MVIPWWGQLIISILNLILSNGLVGAAAYLESGSKTTGAVAGIGSAINHLRNQPSLLTMTKGQ